MDRVLELSNRLRREGVDCWIDQYLRSPSEGWPRWCENQIKETKFVLVVCTETYLRRFEGKEVPGKGKGGTFEGFVITQELYDSQGRNDKFIPVVFSSAERDSIPTLLRGSTSYDISNTDEYNELYWWGLLGQPRVPIPEIGPTRDRPDTNVTHLITLATPEPLQELKAVRDFAPHSSSSLPVPSPFFTGRGAILEKVSKRLKQGKNVALSGMRGVGKTQIAKQYAHSHRKEYSRIFWARAEKHETLVADFASVAQLLGLSQKDKRDQSIIVAAVKNWLETNHGWLVILDNADDISLVEQFVPAAHDEGRVLLTSTASAFGGWAEKISVEQMNPDDAALLLLRRAGVIGKKAQPKKASQVDRKLALALAEKLGGLPLALDQAGAFIEETPSTLAEYTHFYEKEGKRLRELRGGLGNEHPSVTVTFSLAFQELGKRDPLAADLVHMCAFLAPDAIPEEIFTKGGSAIGPEFARCAESPLDFANTIKQAATFSLIRRDAPDRSLDIHRLVQEVLKDGMDPAQVHEWAESALRAVDLAFPFVEFRNWHACERLLPHARACGAWIERFSFESAEAASLLNETGSYVHDRAQYADAEPLYKRSLAIGEKALGPEHPDVATTVNNLALLYKNQERYADAEPLYWRALAIYEKALGPEHPHVAAALNNLATLFRAQTRYAEAERLHQRSLAIREKTLGQNDPGVAESLNNLALLYKNQGRFAEAEPLYQRSLAIYEKASGAEHPDVATSLNNLASLYSSQGRHAEAQPLYKRAIAIDEKALGSDHPALATDLNNLALLYADQGRYGEAEPLYKRCLVIREKAQGPNHPDVATALENYARLLRKTGREAEALPLETRANAIREKMKTQVKP
jgi:tetratricopeptide (TPR) repeat protein